jgi:S1-C subfamily serine protease
LTHFEELSKNMADVVEGAAVGVVGVDARRRFPASGVVWDDGLIVTANHVVESDEEIVVRLPDGNAIAATLVGRDPYNDIALLRVDADLSAAQWANDDAARTGELVLALARPLGDIRVTLGTITGVVNKMTPPPFRKRREGDERGPWRSRRGGPDHHGGPRWGQGMDGPGGKRTWRMPMVPGGYLQTDVLMYPGFSGGPLVGASGWIYGINTSGVRRDGGLAIPVRSVRQSIASLVQHGHIQRGYLGIGVQTAALPEAVAAELERDEGVLVGSVEANSPAAQAGIMVGDILVALGETSIASPEDLLTQLALLPVGDVVAARIVRGGQLRTIDVTIGARA